MSESVRFRWGIQSDVGQVRSVNQDNASVRDGLFLLADGMGGHQGGEVASEVAVETANTGVTSPSLDALLSAVTSANTAIRTRAGNDPGLLGMGTTLCALALVDTPPSGDETLPSPHLVVVNVGDSRVYRYNAPHLEQITQDHSLVETLVREGRITEEEALHHPQRNILTRALGVSDDVTVDYWEFPVRRDEWYLLCSDGLFNEVSDERIAATVAQFDDPQEAADELVRMANEAGARDNVTVVLVHVVEGDDVAPLPLPMDPMVAVNPGAPPLPEPEEESEPTLQMEALDPVAPAAVAAARSEPSSDGAQESTGRLRRFLPFIFGALLLVAAIAVVSVFLLDGDSGEEPFLVGFDGDQVVIFDVSGDERLVAERSSQIRQGLAEAELPQLEAGRRFSSVEEALGWIASLRLAPEPEPTPTVEPTATAAPPPTAGPTTTPVPTVAPTPTPQPTPTVEPTPTARPGLQFPTGFPFPTPPDDGDG